MDNPKPAPTPGAPGTPGGAPDEATLLRLLAEAARDFAIFAVDGEGNILTWNPGVLTITGYEEQEFIGQNCVMLFTPEDREQGAHLQERETARREGQALDERWHLKKDGTRFWGSGFMHALYDDNNHLKGFAKILRDMTAQKRYEQELEARVQERTAQLSAALDSLEKGQAERQELSRRMASIQEQERRRISRELHDSTGQYLTALGLELAAIESATLVTRIAAANAAQAASGAAQTASASTTAAAVAAALAAQAGALPEAARLAQEASEAARTAAITSTDAGAAAAAANAALGAVDEAAPKVAQLRTLVDALSRDIHRLAVDLRPTSLDDLGLVSALVSYTEEWAQRTGIEAEVEAVGLEEGNPSNRLPAEVETALYRIVLEALTNVAKHAQEATCVSITIQRLDGQVVAVIEDDGPGFDLQTAGAGRLGLAGMRERAALCGGTLEIETAPGDGTTIFLRIPIMPE